MITLPLVFYNDGAAAIIIQNLRLLLLDEGSNKNPLFFNATHDRFLKNEGRAFATQFPVSGREAIMFICEFQRKPGNLLFETKCYPIELQAILHPKEEWQKLCCFDLRVNDSAVPVINKQYLAHDNYAVNRLTKIDCVSE